jgi:hypothetical protein
MPKKDTTKTNGKSREELRAQLARDIIAILNNPEAPCQLKEGVHEGIIEVFNNMSGEQQRRLEDTEEYIKTLLDINADKGGAR